MPEIKPLFNIKPEELRVTLQAAVNNDPPWKILSVACQPDGKYTAVFEVPRAPQARVARKRVRRARRLR